MALVVKDRVKETTATTGTGTLTLAGAVAGFQTFTSVLSNGDTTYYGIFESSTGEFEVGLGTFTSSGTTLARTTILESSNSGSAINLTAGAADVFITQPAEKAVYLDGSGYIATADGRNVTNVDAATVDSLDSTQFLRSDAADTKTSGDLTFSDSVKAIFGAGSDLQIYHDGSNSYISDQGTGGLRILNDTNLAIKNAAATADKAIFKTGAEVELYYNGNLKFETTNTGVDVTGTVTADGLTVDTNTLHVDATNNRVGINDTSPARELEILGTANATTYLRISGTSGNVADTNYAGIEFYNTDASGKGPNVAAFIEARSRQDSYGQAGQLVFATASSGSTPEGERATQRLRIADNGDISFYEDTSTTVKFFWDASTERLGIGNSAPTTALDVTGTVTASENLKADGGTLIMGDDAYSTSTSYVGMKTSNMSGSTDYMIISGHSDGNTYVSAKSGNDVYINGGGNVSTYGIKVYPDQNPTVGTSNYTIWHSGNDGSSSGLDADTLDGVQGASYLRSDTNDTFTGTLTVSGNVDINGNLNAVDNIYLSAVMYHEGDTNTYLEFPSGGDAINLVTGGTGLYLNSSGVFIGDGSLAEDYDALSGTTPTCNVDNGGMFSLTMTGNTTFTFSGASSGYIQGFVLQLTGNGSTVTWPTSVDWAGGTAPDAPGNGETDILVFITRDGGTNWYGALAIDAAA